MTNTEYNALIESTKRKFDKVIDVYKAGEFTEVYGKIGGDKVTYRVYKSGMVTER